MPTTLGRWQGEAGDQLGRGRQSQWFARGDPVRGFQNRGAIFTTPGTGFLQAPVGGPGDPATNDLFDVFGVDCSSTFEFFSSVRLFIPVGSTLTHADFSVPGTNGAVPATVAGFGAV
jgi:hypothetical protein